MTNPRASPTAPGGITEPVLSIRLAGGGGNIDGTATDPGIVCNIGDTGRVHRHRQRWSSTILDGRAQANHAGYTMAVGEAIGARRERQPWDRRRTIGGILHLQMQGQVGPLCERRRRQRARGWGGAVAAVRRSIGRVLGTEARSGPSPQLLEVEERGSHGTALAVALALSPWYRRFVRSTAIRVARKATNLPDTAGQRREER